jgi:hypothetical protein
MDEAIKESLQEKSREQVYIVLSSVCGGAIMLIVSQSWGV